MAEVGQWYSCETGARTAPHNAPTKTVRIVPKTSAHTPLQSRRQSNVRSPKVIASSGPINGDMSIDATTIVPESVPSPTPAMTDAATVPEINEKFTVAPD
jgi:hypothetical protein